ncbi:MAG: hypothetical protein WC749_17455, partial [Dehalococcoidia bacterium]
CRALSISASVKQAVLAIDHLHDKIIRLCHLDCNLELTNVVQPTGYSPIPFYEKGIFDKRLINMIVI